MKVDQFVKFFKYKRLMILKRNCEQWWRKKIFNRSLESILFQIEIYRIKVGIY